MRFNNFIMLYLLRANNALGNHRHSARYYLGYCSDGKLAERLAQHRRGEGAAITRAMMQNGGFVLIGTKPGDRRDERRLKNQKKHARLVKKFSAATHAAVLETFTRPDFLRALAIQACIQGFRGRAWLPRDLHPIERTLIGRGLSIDVVHIEWVEHPHLNHKTLVTQQLYRWNSEAFCS